MYKFFKRLFDFLFSLFCLPLLLLLLITIGIAIKIEDKGPIFYYAPRIGKNSKKFDMIKFRSMKVNAPDIRNLDGSTFNSSDDDRVTKIGKFIRKTSLDEVPQIINVLKGDMSIIGPRASTWDVLNTYKNDEIDKMKVRPGITGYTQANYRNSINNRQKRLLDAWYANNCSFKLDFVIFFKTIKNVILRKNIYTNSGNIK